MACGGGSAPSCGQVANCTGSDPGLAPGGGGPHLCFQGKVQHDRKEDTIGR